MLSGSRVSENPDAVPKPRKIWRSKCTKNHFARAMQSPRTKAVTPHETPQSPRTELVSHLARFVSHIARTPGLLLREIPTFFRMNPKVSSLFRRFVRYVEVVPGRYTHFSGLRNGLGIFRDRDPINSSVFRFIFPLFRLALPQTDIRILAGV
ncbi:hypothetical protein BJ322DRAFT_386955 [Thelephora terrestris]|uniref:Uncharacterized protein n=1 Tax=Thelephora terrestris TaxID=56493 RepID=A0A9P6HNG7_9AGAM|nr:hypothetical protein BJ322DRAFT_386955 [Thelephora terrestris]